MRGRGTKFRVEDIPPTFRKTIVFERNDRKEGSSIEDDSRMQISMDIFMHLAVPLRTVKLLSPALTCRSRGEFEILKRPSCAPLPAVLRRRKLALTLGKAAVTSVSVGDAGFSDTDTNTKVRLISRGRRAPSRTSGGFSIGHLLETKERAGLRREESVVATSR